MAPNREVKVIYEYSTDVCEMTSKLKVCQIILNMLQKFKKARKGDQSIM